MAGLSAPSDLFRGFAYPFRGFAFLRKNPDLARYWRWPILITGAALLSSLWLSVHYHDDLLGLLWPDPAGTDWVSRSLTVLHSIVEVFAFFLVALVLGVVCLGFSTVIAAPFNDVLSEVVEQREAGHSAPLFSFERVLRDASRTIRLESLKLVCYAAVMLPVWILSLLVPGVGQVAYVGFAALFSSAYFALDFTDWPASRRGQGIRYRLSVLRSHPWLLLGFGGCVWLLMWVPFVNLWLMPAAVAGGTRLWLDLETAKPGAQLLPTR